MAMDDDGSSASADGRADDSSPASDQASGPGADAADTEDEPTGDGPFERIVREVARDYCPEMLTPDITASSEPEPPADPLHPTLPMNQAEPPPSQPAVPAIWVSVSTQFTKTCIAVTIAVSQVAAFLNALGTATQEAGICDVQIWLQRRRGKKAGDCEEIWGVILDVDVVSTDPFGSFIDAGLPFPTCWWSTRNGYKGCWTFNRSVDAKLFLAIAQQFTISVPGGDPKSWSPEQGQHLPRVNKSTLDGNIPIKLTAVQTNAQPLQIDAFTSELPVRLERALSGGGRLGAGERKSVEDYLSELGTPAPDEAGARSAPYDHCPSAEQHDRPCFYVFRQEDESIDATCLGGHGGELSKRWSEAALYELATGKHRADADIAPVRDIPNTWAGDEYLKQRFSITFASEPNCAELVLAAVAVWMRARASMVLAKANQLAVREGVEITRPIALEDMLTFFERKVVGFDSTGPCRIAFDDNTSGLVILRSNGATEQVKVSGESFAVKPHLHEWRASSAYDIKPHVDMDEETGEKEFKFVYTFDADENQTHWNKAMNGSSLHLVSVSALFGGMAITLFEVSRSRSRTPLRRRESGIGNQREIA